MFKKLKFGTDENLGWGPVHLPEIELQTTAYWLVAGEAAQAGAARIWTSPSSAQAGRCRPSRRSC